MRGVCRQFGRREYFSFLSPWMGPCCFFSVPVSAGDPDGLAGQKGGPSGPPYQGGGLPRSLQV